ncbi:Helicase [Balamuthia mandrillaris]
MTARVLTGASDNDKLQQLISMNYKEQAVWFLNAFWNEFAKNEAEKIWAYKHQMDGLEKKANGCGLDELNAHRFLEKFGETLTVQALRDKLRSSGAIPQGERPKIVPLTHYLIIRYNVDWHRLVHAEQGSSEEIEKAQRLLDEAQAAVQEAEVKDREAKAAKRELEAALAELHAQEQAYNQKTEQLKKASEEGGMVSRNKAKNELAQHLGEDPLPLRRAKISTEAAVKKADKASQAAEAALEEANQRFAAAEAYLEEAKSRGVPDGGLWWMERELHEAKRYLPKSKGGIDK